MYRKQQMNRAIKFKLKNGKIITIRRVRANDYEAAEKFRERFSVDPAAIQTMQYPGRPKNDKESSLKFYAENLLLGAFDGDKIIGTCSVNFLRRGHPYSGRAAGMGMMMLGKYTHNGIGGKFFDIAEKWARENNIHVLQSGVRHKNVRSLGNLLKQGYEIVGVFHDTAFINGEWHHEYLLEKILEK